MADSMEMQAIANDPKNAAASKNNGLNNQSAINNNGGNQSNTQSGGNSATPDRASVYDVNYEISV